MNQGDFSVKVFHKTEYTNVRGVFCFFSWVWCVSPDTYSRDMQQYMTFKTM